MEALTAVAVAALTIYDMVKAVDKAMVIGDIRLDVQERRTTAGLTDDAHDQPVLLGVAAALTVSR